MAFTALVLEEAGGKITQSYAMSGDGHTLTVMAKLEPPRGDADPPQLPDVGAAVPAHRQVQRQGQPAPEPGVPPALGCN